MASKVTILCLAIIFTTSFFGVCRAQLGIPPKMLFNLDKFNILLELITTTNLASSVLTTKDVTTFAPTDEAFRLTAIDIGCTSTGSDALVLKCFRDRFTNAQLTAIVKYHAVKGLYPVSKLNKLQQQLTSISGRAILSNKRTIVDLSAGFKHATLINQFVDIVYQDIIIHGINRVLLPFVNFQKFKNHCKLIDNPVVLINAKFVPLFKFKNVVRKCAKVRMAIRKCKTPKVCTTLPKGKAIIAFGITTGKAVAAATTCRNVAAAVVACRV